MIDVGEIKRKLYNAQGRRQHVEAELVRCRASLDAMNRRLKLVEDAQVFLQKVAQDTQSQLRIQVEDIVNLALETCFPGEYSFQLRFNVARGRTDAELVFLSQRTGRELDPMGCAGGGVVDLTCFALRIASFVLEQGIDNVIILDEPFKFISRDLQERASEVLKELSTKLGLQIIMVTHIPEFIDCADSVIRIKKNADGVSKII